MISCRQSVRGPKQGFELPCNASLRRALRPALHGVLQRPRVVWRTAIQQVLTRLRGGHPRVGAAVESLPANAWIERHGLAKVLS